MFILCSTFSFSAEALAKSKEGSEASSASESVRSLVPLRVGLGLGDLLLVGGGFFLWK